MPDGSDQAVLKLVGRIADLDAGAWDACAGDDNPFVSHAFLKALEDSGSVGERTGWLPRHLVLEDESGALAGAAPMYVKGHSYGEYVFDHGWAAAYERAGGRYYPKLLVAVPFTPVPGPRLLVRSGPEAETARATLAAGLVAAAEQLGVSSLHVTFAREADAAVLEAAGLMLRRGLQYHWHNPGYGSFDDFLAALSSRKRKAIRKERQAVADQGIRLLPLTGSDIRPVHWDAFFRFYMDTGGRKWGRPYLTREFFDLIGAGLADRILLVMAEQDGRLIGGALNLIGGDALYGRNWGCIGDFPFLHFEACYYQAIEFAIARGLARVEAGAQGEHKIQRGYLPVETVSAHWVADPNFAAAVADFLKRETRAVREEGEALAEFSPFRRERGA
ncbi:MAG: hypothetical protein BroJett029_42990 [Alphaproteobacteria bacterium]|nr:MAG: hypothetical protein BroJett029_42990 [Alphaproteobacteria bacterium]